jgi:F-type H+-transporting ATPase subunit epsilon
MHLDIITPEKMLFTGDIEIVKLPGTMGSFEIMINHAPLISTLATGRIRVKDVNGVVSYFDILGGVVEVLNNRVKVLVDS